MVFPFLGLQVMQEEIVNILIQSFTLQPYACFHGIAYGSKWKQKVESNPYRKAQT